MKIAILARSNKRRHDKSYGCCVAGITENGEWIRLVADEGGDSLPDDNTTPRVATVIEADIVQAPLEYQVENAILGYWNYIDNEDPNDYVSILVQPNEQYLFGSTCDKLNISERNKVEGSLRIVDVQALRTYKSEGWRASFIYNGNEYEISMTAPNGYGKGGTVKDFGDACIVVSTPKDSPFLKFVAAIYPQN
jgi:hypothetical protein